MKGDNFDINIFNKSYDENRLKDDFADEGYGDWLKNAESKVPFKKLTKPLDVARGLAFLCSSESGIMTGSIIDFDQTIAGWHSYSAYDSKKMDNSLLGE